MCLDITSHPPISLQLSGPHPEPHDCHPGDIVTVVLEIRKHHKIRAIRLGASLVGQTRVWIHPQDRPDIHETMIYTHVRLLQNLSETIPSIDSSTGETPVVMPVSFVLPEILNGRLTKYNRLPPSCEVGSAYFDYWGRRYMQPLIEYYVQVTLTYNGLSETDELQAISTKHKIKVLTPPHNEPPTYAQSMTYVQALTASAEVRRSWFSKPLGHLCLKMEEPLPVVRSLPSNRPESTAVLKMYWLVTKAAYEEFGLKTRVFRIDCRLKARTTYTTNPIIGTGEVASPCFDGKRRTRIETTHLATLKVSASERDNMLITSGYDFQRIPIQTVAVPIRVDEETIPTFSCLLARRDYSLSFEVDIQGLHHATLSIETPLQICESSMTQNYSNTDTMSRAHVDMLLAEALPKYENESSNDTLY